MLVPSQLSILLHRIVELSESILLIRVSVVSCVVALVLLHRKVRVLCAWNVLTRHLIIVTSKLVESFLVEVVTLRVKEITTWQNVETILIIFTRSVLNFLSGVLLHSRCGFLLSNLRLASRGKAFLRHHLDVDSISWSVGIYTQLWLSLCHCSVWFKLVNLLWRWRLSLIFELTIGETVLLIELLLVNFK